MSSAESIPAMQPKQLACASCRMAKVKCTVSADGMARTRSEDPCLRCIKYGLECHFPTRKKRQRLKGSESDESPRMSSEGAPSLTTSRPSQHSPISRLTTQLASQPSTVGLHHLPAVDDSLRSAFSGTTNFLSTSDLVSASTLAEVHQFSRDQLSGLMSGTMQEYLSLPLSPGLAGSATSSSPHQSSSFQGSSASVPPTTMAPHLSQPKHQKRPRAFMSLNEEVQEAKDDFGIPISRNASRRGSPEMVEGFREDDTQTRNRFWLGSTMTTEPDLPGVLTSAEVTYLFEKYFEFHNMCIGLLDPSLHTPAYTCSTSPLLFCAILTVASENFQPDKYMTLWRQTRSLIDKAFAVADESIELCQAVSLVNAWKDAEDRRASLRFGFAIRIAYHLGLNRPPRRPLPQDELAARLELNRERTWIHLSHFEVLINGMYGGIPSMVQSRPAAEIEAWLADHPLYYCSSDIVHPATAWMAPIIAETVVPQETNLSKAERQARLERARPLIAEWPLRWLGRRPPIEYLSRSTRQCFEFIEKALARDIANMARLTATEDDGEQSLWDDIYAAMASLRVLAMDLSPQGVLFWAPNSAPLHASKCGMLLTKYIASIRPTTASCVMAIFEDIYRASSAGAVIGTRKMFLAKLFGSLHRISKSRLAAVSGDENVAASSASSNFQVSDGHASWDLETSHVDSELANNGSEAQRLLEASIEDFVSQFFSIEGTGSIDADMAPGVDAGLSELLFA